MNAQLQPRTQHPASTFPVMLNAYKTEIARALPKHLDGDRMARIALTCFRQNPKLGDCDPKSVFAAVVMAAQLGLEPGIGGQAYLIPYGRECNFVPGWQGLVDLVSRAGRASVWTGAVFEGDEFEYALGDSPHVTHRPAGDDDPAKLTHVYAVGRIDGAHWPVIEVWPMAKVLRHRDRYNKVGKRHYSYQNIEMYGRKVALLQVLKYMPKSVELLQAVTLENAEGRQGLDTQSAIDGTWAPVPDAPEAEHEPLPEYTADEFRTQIDKWKPALESGKRSADEIIAMAETKATLTEAQKLVIRDYAAPAAQGGAA
jgi:recombination protein RecT